MALLQTETWIGKFRSTVLGNILVNGEIQVQLKPKSSEPYVTWAKLRYSGLFRHNVELKVNLQIKSDQMSFNIDQQEITFNTQVWTEEIIKGTYLSTNPGDQGSFELIPERLKDQLGSNYYVNQCMIC